MRSIDDFLGDATLSIEKTREGLLRHVGKIIALLCIVIAATLTFTDVTLIGVFGPETVSTLVIMSVSAVLIYCSMQSEGEGAGRECERYRALIEEGRRLSGKVRGPLHGELACFLEEYLRADAERRRHRLLRAHGITEQAYDAYLAGTYPNKKHRHVLRRARRIRPRELPVEVLLSEEAEDNAVLFGPKRGRGMRTLTRLLPSLFGMLITLSVVIEWKTGLTGEVILEGVLKLSALLTVGLRGYVDGYRYVAQSLCAFIGNKNRLLDTFLLSKEINEPK